MVKRAGEGLIYLEEGEEVPSNARLIEIKTIFSHYESDIDTCHEFQNPHYWKVYKTVFVYELF